MSNRLLAFAFLAALSTNLLAHGDRPSRYFAYEIPAPELDDPLCVPGYATTEFATDFNNRRFAAGGVGCFHQEGTGSDGLPFFFTSAKPYAWSPQTGSYLLPRDGEASALPLGVDVYNNAYGFQSGNALDGVKWSPGGGLSIVIGADPTCGFGISIAIDANVRGEITGWAFRPVPDDPFGCNLRAVVRRPGGEEVVGPVGGSPAAITNAGVAVGNINNHAARWNSRTGEVVFLRPESDPETTGVLAVNERGVAVGTESVLESSGPPACTRVTPLLWDARNRERLLPKLPGSISSTPTGINEDGVIVGSASPVACNNSANELARAVIWTQGSVTDLNRLLVGRPGIVLLGTSNINDRGEIIAFGYRAHEPRKPCPQFVTTPDGGFASDDSTCHDTHAYLLVPVN